MMFVLEEEIKMAPVLQLRNVLQLMELHQEVVPKVMAFAA
jgi:hypothetical protein